ncbi:MAG: DUF2520 domain-containing protein [Gemmatimonadaceae bacterium]|nr:DUF2520 domain-containing protein [Gemmatimonadaceae bacterium]
MSDRVFILGAGRAGRGLSRALRASGVAVVGLHGRRANGGAEKITAGPLPDAVRRAKVVIVAVRDSQLGDALRELESAGLATGAVVLHASGSAEPPELDALRRAGHPAGTFHPLVPIADPARAAELFRGAFVGLDGDANASAAGERLAGALGARTLRIPRGEKAAYHAAAVIASNFPTVLAALAARLLVGLGVGEGDAWDAIRALMRGAVANLDSDTPARALTGPIARGDADTVRRHLAALGEQPEMLALYRGLSRIALEIARDGGTSEDALETIDEMLKR